MKTNTAQAGSIIVPDGRDVATIGETHEAGSPRFAHQLRALGQALEKFSFSAFDLEVRSGTYLVTGTAISNEQVKFSFSQFVHELLRGCKAQATVTCGDNQVDLRFTPQEIEGFESSGKTNRKDPDKMPDPYSISQILRGAGSFLDNHSVAALVGISLKERWVTVNYQTAEGRLEQAKQDLEYFYDYWVKMYLRRSNRAKLPPPSDPTVLVTWQGIRRTQGLLSG
jgi:hypothetical protein